MKKRNYLLTTIILLCAFTTANAQFVDDDFDDLLDFGEDEEEVPLHDEYFNQIYVQYSPTRYNFDGATPNLHFNEFAVGYNRAIQIVEKKPFFIEAGLQLKYSTCSGDDDRQNASFKLFTFKLPINVTYKLYIPHSEVAFAPYAGVYFRAGLTGKQSLNSNKTDLYDHQLANTTGAEWERCQLGWQAGLRIWVQRFYVGFQYGKDFPDENKLPQIYQSSVTFGVTF